jgi:hypothetical protein
MKKRKKRRQKEGDFMRFGSNGGKGTTNWGNFFILGC